MPACITAIHLVLTGAGPAGLSLDNAFTGRPCWFGGVAHSGMFSFIAAEHPHPWADYSSGRTVYALLGACGGLVFPQHSPEAPAAGAVPGCRGAEKRMLWNVLTEGEAEYGFLQPQYLCCVTWLTVIYCLALHYVWARGESKRKGIAEFPGWIMNGPEHRWTLKRVTGLTVRAFQAAAHSLPLPIWLLLMDQRGLKEDDD